MDNKARRGYTLVEFLVTGAAVAIITGLATVAYFGGRAVYSHLTTPKIERANVIEGPEAELFTEKNEIRLYAEIDGNPAKDYLTERFGHDVRIKTQKINGRAFCSEIEGMSIDYWLRKSD